MDIYRSISVDITYKCNLRCKHCYNESGEKSNLCKELSDDELMSLAMDISKLYVESMCICGGETLLRFDIACQMAKYIKENSINKDISVNMVTNGLLIDDAKISKIKEAGFSIIQISIDGFETAHDWLRGKSGAFKKSMSAIKRLIDEGVHVAIACAPSKRNRNDIIDLARMANELGVMEFRVQPMMKLGRAHGIENDLLQYNEYLQLARELKLFRSKEKCNMVIEWGDPIQHLVGIKSLNDGIDFITLSAYGEILLTPYLPLVFGDIRKHSLLEYINSGLNKKWRNDFVEKTISLIESPDKFDVSKSDARLPKIVSGNNIVFDIIDDDIEKSSLYYLDKYNLQGGPKHGV